MTNIYSKMMECVLPRKKKMSEPCEGFRIYPQKTINVKVYDKTETRNDPDVQAAVKAVAEKLGEKGRIHVRESVTEPVEAESYEICLELCNRVVEVIKSKGHAVK